MLQMAYKWQRIQPGLSTSEFNPLLGQVTDISITDRESVVKAQLISSLKQQSFEFRSSGAGSLQLALIIIAADLYTATSHAFIGTDNPFN